MARISEYVDIQRKKNLARLIETLGLPPSAPVNWDLLNRALTHASYSPVDNYEHLEFLGDAVLRLAAATFLLEHESKARVGHLAAVRSQLVSDRTLAKLADQYNLETYLRMSDSAAGDRAGRLSRLADAFEAVLGALYLSTHDLSLISPWLTAHLQRLAQVVKTDPALQNYKAALQEWTQAHFKALPEYRVQEVGKTHGDPHRFHAEVWFQSKQLGEGTGPSIKQAEQAAAQVAFQSLKTTNPDNLNSKSSHNSKSP